MTTANIIGNVPKYNQAIATQATESQALRKQIVDLRREFVTSTTTILAVNDDFTNQVTTMSDRTMLLERRAEQKFNELHEIIETCRDLLHDVKADISEIKSQIESCVPEVKALSDNAHRTSERMAEAQDGYNKQAQAINTLQSTVAALSPSTTSTIQASPFATLAAKSVTTAQPFPANHPAFGCYGFGTQAGQFRFNS